MTTKGLLELFRDVVTGGRDAAERNEVRRCKHEINLAKSMLVALEDASPTVRFSEGIEDYVRHAEFENNEIMKWRGNFYRSLLRAAGEVTAADIARSKLQHFNALVAVLQIGLTLAHQGNEEGNLRRVAIEADHIHNIPTYLTSDGNQSIDYYLETERTYYLDRIEQYFGKSSRASVADSFSPHWRIVMS